jgi:hypothetical protein
VLLTERACAQAHLDVLAMLARDCRCYRLRTGRDFERLSRIVRELADEAAAVDEGAAR